MTTAHSNSADHSGKEPKVFVVGTIANTEKFLSCCPHASTWLCVEEATEKQAVIAIPCRRWGCKWCGPKKAFHLGIRCELAAPTKFITVTTWTKNYLGPRDAYDRTRRKIADFAKLVRKEVGEFEYLRVLERHANGFPHYHFVARCRYIPQKVLVRIWENLTGNFIVDVRTVDKRTNVFKYVMKYLCKQEYVPWTTRRVSWSKAFFPKAEPRDPSSNPYVAGERKLPHPADYLATHFQKQIVIERKPGIYVIDSIGLTARQDHDLLIEQENRKWRRNRPPSTD